MNPIYKTIKVTALSALCGVALILPLKPSFATIGLKQQSVVTDNTIKLGDIFYGLERNEDRILGTAPRPGEELTINARTLLRIALALDLSWRPSGNADQVTIRRDATIIPFETIEEKLTYSLKQDGMIGDFEISLADGYREIILPPEADRSLIIENIRTDKSSGRFTATMIAPSKSNPIFNAQIIGYVHPTVQIPVLKDNIQNGSIIRARDIHFVKVREKEFSKSTLIDPQQLIGMTARRYIMAGRPINHTDVIPPQVISRGQLATLSFDSGPLNITTQVKALENGARGDVIRVVNLSSNQTIQAIITGENALQVIDN